MNGMLRGLSLTANNNILGSTRTWLIPVLIMFGTRLAAVAANIGLDNALLSSVYMYIYLMKNIG